LTGAGKPAPFLEVIMKKIKWKRPSGSTLETNDSEETIKYLESLGYEQIKRGPKAKDKDEHGRQDS
jgi:hypothetical protein